MTDKKKQETNYEKLRKIDVSDHIEKKNKFNYLSWSYALDEMLKADNDATWEYGDLQVFADGSVMIYCTVTMFDKPRTMQLPVLDYKNQPIKNPNAMQINTSMQRCLAKAIAAHGIGLYIYHGEDLPPEEKPEPTPAEIAAQEKAAQMKVYKAAAKKIIADLDKKKKTQSLEEFQEHWSQYEDDMNNFKDASEKLYKHVLGHYEDAVKSYEVF